MARRATFPPIHLRLSPVRDKFGRSMVDRIDRDRRPIFSDHRARSRSSRPRFARRFPLMMWSSRWRPTGNTAAVSLVLAAIGLLSTTEARAGCHHPWVRRLNEPTTLTDLRILDHTGDFDRLHRDPSAPPAPSPCARGACSPAPMIPVSSPEPTLRRAELGGILGRGSIPSPSPLADRLSDQFCASPRHRTAPVERPPR
jgi:hypothetical protein